MFRWLNGPGLVFKDPLPGSTNYLNAYDAAGNLIRTKDMDMNKTVGDKDRSRNFESKESKEKDEDEVAQDEASTARKRTPLSDKLVKEREAARRSDEPGLPAEKDVDLMPFPLNPMYRSQRVLSEELRDEIYKRITDGNSVRDVSAALGVEMRRVAAVVRLKAVEKQWEKEVCQSLLLGVSASQYENMMSSKR